jgi:hypothetical protein
MTPSERRLVRRSEGFISFGNALARLFCGSLFGEQSLRLKISGNRFFGRLSGSFSNFL